MTHVIKTAAGNRILSAILLDLEPNIDDLEDLEVELEEARAYACGLLDRVWSVGQELERCQASRATDIDAFTVRRWLDEWLPHIPVPVGVSDLSVCTEARPCEIHQRLGVDW